jgi:hypothetical protein
MVVMLGDMGRGPPALMAKYSEYLAMGGWAAADVYADSSYSTLWQRNI